MPPTLPLLDLASCAPTLRTARLSAGWLNCWGHRIVAVESFADHQRFRSTARKAGDWQGLMVGLHEHPARVGLGSGGAVRGGVVPDQPGVLAGRLSAPSVGVENLSVRLGSAETTAPAGAGPVAGAASLAVRAQVCLSSPALCRGRELCHPAGLLSTVRQPGSKRPAICLPMAFKSAPIAPRLTATAHGTSVDFLDQRRPSAGSHWKRIGTRVKVGA
jgi:hypothetical protein